MTERAGVPLGPRLLDLARGRSLARARRAAARVARARGIELGLRRAGRTGACVLVGPFLGEVGFELLYWIPWLRRELGRNGVDPERVTVLTRGGAGVWYSDFAGRSLDVLDLISTDELRERVGERERRLGTVKQLELEPLDRELIRLARERTGGALVVHPLAMYGRLRWFWEGREPVERLPDAVAYRPLRAPTDALPRAARAALPRDYVVLKAYFSRCFPDSARNRGFLRDLLARLAHEHELVLLATGLRVDDHADWRPEGARVHTIESWLRPGDNLAVQTELVAGARALVSTYGGFSYLGALLGVPTLAFRSLEEDVRLHLDALRQAAPRAEYRLVEVGDGVAVDSFLERLAAVGA